MRIEWIIKGHIDDPSVKNTDEMLSLSAHYYLYELLEMGRADLLTLRAGDTIIETVLKEDKTK